MAESMPGTLSVFAAAYQNMLASQGRGGGLTGQAAVAALLEAVPTGQVRSNEILPFVSEEMQRRAAPKLDIAKETSQAWQGRLQNQQTGWAMIASEAGVEEGQRNFFRFFTQWMNQNQDIPEKFGKFWKEFSEQFAIAGGFPDLIRMTLEGQETIIREWLGSERTERMIKNFESLSEKAGKAAEFLGLFQKQPEVAQESVWQTTTRRGESLLNILTSAANLDPLGMSEGQQELLMDETSYLMKALLPWLVKSTVKPSGVQRYARLGYDRSVDGYNFAFNPERDDNGFAIPYLRMMGKEPYYHPTGVELLTAGQGGQQSGGDTIVLNIPGVTLMTNTNSREETQETLAEFFEDMLNRAMPAKN